MMLQAMWTAGLTWDQKLPAELAKGALTWFKELPALSRIKIPRSLKEPEQVADLTDEELMTAIVGAEGLINSRPITYQSSNVDDQIIFCSTKLEVSLLQNP